MSSNAALCQRQLRRPAYQDLARPCPVPHPQPLDSSRSSRLSRHLLCQPCSRGGIRPGAAERWLLTPREEGHDTRPLRGVPSEL